MEPKKKTFKIATLGCRTNQYESAAYASQLYALDYVEAKGDEEAELCIVNTCTVTQGADRSSRHKIRQLVAENPTSKLVVTGCLADRLVDEISSIDGVDCVVLNKDKEALIQVALTGDQWSKEQVVDFPEFTIDQFGGHTRAFVKVQDGCNSFCSYCIIPYVRGRSKSRPLASIIKEVEGLVKGGYKEVVITGINVGDYDGGDGKSTLADLVKEVDQVEGLKRLRISSIDPDEVDENLLSAVIEGCVTCHSMHIVLQSGSNAILKRMNRKYTTQMFVETIERCRGASRDFSFTTDIIVGFPGETAKDFADTLDLVKEVGFAKVHMFPYSRRDRTKAATREDFYKNEIPREVIAKRKQELLRLAEQTAFSLREKYVGRVMPVLIEADNKGHTENFFEVHIPGKSLCSNQILSVEMIENTPEGLIGCAF